MVCAICSRKTVKQFVREDMILCYVCRNLFDSSIKLTLPLLSDD